MQLTRPSLLLDEAKCRLNIQKMATKATAAGVFMRPHFKTHQSKIVGEWFREVGVEKITVSSVKMAEYFAESGWKDITIAFPFNAFEAEALLAFPSDVQLNILVTTTNSLPPISKAVKRNVGVFVKVDTGYNRTGFKPEQLEEIKAVVNAISNQTNFTFKGFLAHEGHSYNAEGDKNWILEVNTISCNQMVALGKVFRPEFPDLELSVGSTPTCSVSVEFPGVTDIRPGNFIFYDWAQTCIGSCEIDDISVCMAVPVVAEHPNELKIITHGGGIHFSKDALTENGEVHYGKVVKLTNNGWSKPLEGWKVARLSQEHGTLFAKTKADFKQFKTGDWLGILPVHSCLTADAMKGYQTLEGKKIDHCEGNAY